MHIAEEAACKFIIYTQNQQINWPELDGSLIGHIVDWLYDEGPDVVNGSFDVFVQTVLIIIDEWHKDPSLLDYRQTRIDGRLWTRKRRPSCIFKDEDDRRGWMLEQARYNSIVTPHPYRRRQPSLT